MRKLKLLTATGLLLAANFSFGASFDCQKASMPIEKAICANPVLSSLDEQMAETYGKAKVNNSNPDKLKQEQVSWIKEVRSCSDDACIESQYNARISTLKNQIEQSIPIVLNASSEQNSVPEVKPVEETASEASSNSATTTNANPTPVQDAPLVDHSTEEIAYGYGSGLVFLLINFLIYNKFPKIRFLAIATPFDIGSKFDKTEAYEASKKSRHWSELWILLAVTIIYLLMMAGSRTGSVSFEEIIGRSIAYFFISYCIYVVWHGIKGFSSRCPKCKNSYAKHCVNSYSEPKTTYEDHKPAQKRIGVIEVGVNHSDFECTVCGHSWHVAKNYKKEVSHSYYG